MKSFAGESFRPDRKLWRCLTREKSSASVKYRNKVFERNCTNVRYKRNSFVLVSLELFLPGEDGRSGKRTSLISDGDLKAHEYTWTELSMLHREYIGINQS